MKTKFEAQLDKTIHKLFTAEDYWVRDCIEDIKAIIIESRHETPKPEFKSMHEMLAYVRGQEDWAKKMNLITKEKKHVITK